MSIRGIWVRGIGVRPLESQQSDSASVMVAHHVVFRPHSTTCTLGFGRITTSLEKVHKHMKIHVGNARANTDVPLTSTTTQKA